MAKQIILLKGPDGEVLPPPMIASVLPDDAVETLLSECALPDLGSSNMYVEGYKAYLNIATVMVHQKKLREVIAGKYNSPIEEALYKAVVEDQLPMSLRPLGEEHLRFKTFIPVLQKIGDKLWRVGIPGKGKVKIFTDQPKRVVEKAQKIYVDFSESE